MARQRKEPDISQFSGRQAAWLRKCREKAGLSVAEAANLAGIPQATLFAYERGRLAGGTDLPWDRLPDLARAYRMSTRDLIAPK